MKLSLATWDHDRCMPLHDGRVSVPGVDFESHILPTGKLFPMAVKEARFDITELSVSSYILQVSRGDCAYTAIPAFVSRAFRHNGFFALAGSSIKTLADLAGKRVSLGPQASGIPVNAQAILAAYGLIVDDIEAVYLHSGEAADRLEAGEIDAFFAVGGLPVEAIDKAELQEHWDYIYEPDAADLLDNVLTRYIESQVYRAAVENVACEMASKMVAMKAATDNAGKFIDQLQLIYNKARQAAITQEISEIVGGAAAV